MKRRHFLAGAAGALLAPALPRAARAQYNSIEPLIRAITGGAPLNQGRVTLELPQLADNGNSVPMRVTVASPMTSADYVKSIHLLSERNPVPRMATFHLGQRTGKAEIRSRVRLAGSQRVTAVAELSDGSFWSGSAQVVVTLSACMDES
jgi:sulfur-oxidizing protein SoxY